MRYIWFDFGLSIYGYRGNWYHRRIYLFGRPMPFSWFWKEG